MDNHDHNIAALHFLAVWAGTLVGVVTLNQWVLGATLVYTLLRIFISVRTIWRDKS